MVIFFTMLNISGINAQGSRRKKAKGYAKTKTGGRREGRYHEAGRQKLEECCKEQGQLAEASKEGLGSKWAVVPIMTTMINAQVIYLGNGLQPMRRRLFLKQMFHDLVIGEITRRSIKSVEMPIDLNRG
jgi:hypothetical protein